MKKLKYKIEHITRKEIKDIRYIKQSIFNGTIFIFKKFSSCEKIVHLTNGYFYKYFGYNIENFIKNENPKIFEKKKIEDFQEKIKNSNKLSVCFGYFLRNLKFNIKETSSDKITFRYSPVKKNPPRGILKPTKAHRDTWASNVFNQINWWLPLHNVDESNSIFIAPDYFKKKVDNNSNEWSFENFKKIKNYPSTPISEMNFNKKNMINFKLEIGDVLCFSGNHIHGSVQGEKKRINLETRTICVNDEKNFVIPRNIDSYTNKKKINWFCPLTK